jgi:DNA replication initiation complex subunit (GINS family)
MTDLLDILNDIRRNQKRTHRLTKIYPDLKTRILASQEDALNEYKKNPSEATLETARILKEMVDTVATDRTSIILEMAYYQDPDVSAMTPDEQEIYKKILALVQELKTVTL